MDGTIFHKLVTELSTDERKDLIQKLNISNPNDNALISAHESIQDIDYEEEFLKLSFFQRIILYIKKLFSSKSKTDLIEEHLVNSISKSIMLQAPAFIDMKNNILLNPFFTSLALLQEKLILLRPAISFALKEKPAFLSFIMSTDYPEIIHDLQKAVDFSETDDSSNDEAESKHSAEAQLSAAFDSIFDTEKSKMYANAKNLHYLNNLVHFDFNKFLDLFTKTQSGNTCSLTAAGTNLIELSSILLSQVYPPSMKFFKNLAVFHYLTKNSDTENSQEFEKSIKSFMLAANDAMGMTRGFNSDIPLHNIVKVIKNDPLYSPKLKISGEDWFILFKQFWQNLLKENHKSYINNLRYKTITRKVKTFLKVDNLYTEIVYKQGCLGYDVSAKYELSMLLLHHFLLNLYEKSHSPIIKIVLIEGDFYKEQNRKELTDAVNDLSAITNRLKLFEDNVSFKGQMGKMAIDIQNEMSAYRVRRKKVADLLEKADNEAEQLIKQSISSLSEICNVLSGILYGKSGTRFDTVANLNSLSKKLNNKFITLLQKTFEEIKSALDILAEIYDTENAVFSAKKSE